MRKTIMFASLAAALLAAPGVAFGLGTIEGFYGIARPPSASFRASVTNTQNEPKLFKNSLQIAGGDVLLNFSWLEVGAIADVNWADKSASQTAIGALLGTKISLSQFRIDLLGEAGGHKYGNFSNVQGSTKEQWLTYVGLRPGIGYSFGSGGRGFMLGLWGYARWDVTNGNANVTVADVNQGRYKLGGVSIGATVRAGFDF